MADTSSTTMTATDILYSKENSTMSDGMSPADMAAMMGNEGLGGNGAWWIILFFIFAMGNGGFGWGGDRQYATSDDVQRGFDNQNSMANQREILSAVNQNFHDTTSFVGDRYNELQRDVAALAVGQQQALAQQQQCCCDTKMLVSETAAQQRYDSAMQNNAVLQAIQDQGAQTRAMLQQDKIESLQQQVSQLQLAQAMQGVVRYPDSFAYNAGSNPFCGCGTSCNI